MPTGLPLSRPGVLVAAVTPSSESSARAVATTVHPPAVMSCATARPIPVEQPVAYTPCSDRAGRCMGAVPLPSWQSRQPTAPVHTSISTP